MDTAIGYLGQAALLLRREAHADATPIPQARKLVNFATAIQILIKALEREGQQ